MEVSKDGTHRSCNIASVHLHHSDPSVDLAPSETHRVPLNRPGSKLPLYFVAPGVHRFSIIYTSGITRRSHLQFRTPELKEDAMVIESSPAELIVKFEKS